MRAKRAKPVVTPRLEPLEARLALAASLTPLPDDPGRFTLRIDLRLHPRGDDGLPDTTFLTRADGAVNVVLVGRQPEVLYRGDAGVIDRIELVGSADVDYVLVGDRLGPPLTFNAAPEDVLVQIGEPIPVPPQAEEPEPPDPTDPLPGGGPLPPPGPAPESPTPLPVLATNSELLFDGGLFLTITPAVPPSAEPAKPAEEEERPSVPPELLGGEPVEEPLDVRRLTGGSHVDAPPAGLWGSEASAEEEPAANDGEPPDPEAVSQSDGST